MANCCIALGGNTGEPQKTFDNALKALRRKDVNVTAVSSTITSAPMGADAGGVFCNAAATVSTQLSPQDLLKTLHSVESELGRTRSVHWGPRSLDLDLIFYEDIVLDTEEIVVPHPSMWYRQFVVTSMNEIASEWHHPTLGETVATLQTRLECRPLRVDVVLPAQVSTADLEAALPPEHCLKLHSVSAQQPPDDERFARFVESDTQRRAQPILETERIVRVPVDLTGGNRLGAWQQAIRDFHSAAAG